MTVRCELKALTDHRPTEWIRRSCPSSTWTSSGQQKIYISERCSFFFFSTSVSNSAALWNTSPGIPAITEWPLMHHLESHSGAGARTLTD